MSPFISELSAMVLLRNLKYYTINSEVRVPKTPGKELS